MSKLFWNRLLILCLMSFLLVGAGCSSSPKIDASSDETFKASLQEMVQSLPEDKRESFQKTFVGMTVLLAFSKKGDQEEIRRFYDGMTYEDIMSKAQELQNKVQSKQ